MLHSDDDVLCRQLLPATTRRRRLQQLKDYGMEPQTRLLRCRLDAARWNKDYSTWLQPLLQPRDTEDRRQKIIARVLHSDDDVLCRQLLPATTRRRRLQIKGLQYGPTDSTPSMSTRRSRWNKDYSTWLQPLLQPRDAEDRRQKNIARKLMPA